MPTDRPRRRLAAIGVALVFLLAACGGSDPAQESAAEDRPAQESAAPAPAAEESTAGAEPVEIAFASHLAGMQAVVDAYNASQDGVQVSFEEYPAPASGGRDRLSNAISAGNAPDVMMIEYPDLPGFVSQGGLQPVDELAPDALAAYPSNVLSTVTFADQTWGLPYDAPPMVMYYRADVFEELGIEPPQTWDDYRAAAETIAGARPGTTIGSYFIDPRWLAGLAWQNGGSWFSTEGDSWVVNLDDAPTREVAEYWQGLYDDGLVTAHLPFSDEWSNDLGSGAVVSYIGASWGAEPLRVRTEASSSGAWRAAPLPHWGTPASALFGGVVLAVDAQTDQPEAAADFASWMATSQESLEARGDVGAAFPAIPELRAIPQQEYSVDHFAGQEIYDVFAQASDDVVEGWTWGPSFSTLTGLGDGLGGLPNGATITGALAEAEASTIAQMREAGLSVQAP
jgi:multiple sugar transport system substrate-binding protein